ncbi:hypothetical protein CCP2SC5_20074 [Azospirillaceae bacterium]
MFKNQKPGKRGFAEAFAVTATAGAAAFAVGSGVAGEGNKGVNTVSASTSGGVNGSTVSVINIGSTGGVSVIGGKVWIDGQEIPEDVTVYRSVDGKLWTIRRENGHIHVSSDK